MLSPVRAYNRRSFRSVFTHIRMVVFSFAMYELYNMSNAIGNLF